MASVPPPSDRGSPPPLPPGFELVSELARRAGVRVVAARSITGQEGQEPADGGSPLVLRLESGTGQEGRAELAVLAAVDHPGLARLRGHGTLPGGGTWVARDWVDGPELGAWFRSLDSGVTEELLAGVLARLCDALEHLHARGFVHADIKPANVLVRESDEGPQPVLCDYGLTRRDGRDGAGAEEAPSGSLFFLAPEVLLGASASPAADLFSLGVLIHGLLVGHRVGAREFYGRFPAHSFFDAVGTQPDELPEWARDIVASLVARDPARRPSSAGAVARLLRSRFGIERPGEPEEPAELRWGPALGREGWLEGWYAAAAGELDSEPRWVQVPRQEDVRAVRDCLHLHAALRGRRTRSLDALDELGGLGSTVELDRWARRVAAESGGAWILATLEHEDPWARHGLAFLGCALRQRSRGGDGGQPSCLVVVSPESPRSEAAPREDGAWRETTFPRLELTEVQRVLDRRFPGETAERRAELARILHGGSEGSAHLLERLLLRAFRAGWILSDPGGLSLRPGPLPPELVAVAQESTTKRRPTEVEDPAAREVGLALAVCGGRAAIEELVALVGETIVAQGASRLVELDLARFVTTRGGLRLVGEDGPAPEDSPRLRELHGARSRDLGAKGGDRGAALAHAWRADPGEAPLTAVIEELAQLREHGCTEKGHELLDRMMAHLASVGMDPATHCPRLLLERVLCWTRLGRAEPARPAVEALQRSTHPMAEALAEFALGSLAILRNDSEEALAHLRRAADLDPTLEGEALTVRIDTMHRAGRDQEVVDAVESLAHGGSRGLLRRQVAYLESIAAVSCLRLGRVEEARERLTTLIEEARRLGDASREAALCINLATLQRRTGSSEEAVRLLDRSIDLYGACGVVSGVALGRSTLGGLLRERGDMPRAEALQASAAEMRERLGDSAGANVTRGMLGMLLFERGHPRVAIEELAGSAARMRGAQGIRFAPLLLAMEEEMRARIGDGVSAGGEPPAADDAVGDPRVFVSRARTAWHRGHADLARELAQRGHAMADSLGQATVVTAAELLVAQLDLAEGLVPAFPDTGTSPTLTQDRRILELLDPELEAFPRDEAIELAEALETSGRDDRAARMWIALAARGAPDASAGFAARADEILARAGRGLTESESRAFRTTLLGIPDPWPGDLTPRRAETTDEEFEMEIASLLEINHRLLEQRDLTSLLGEIVENALRVTGGERGFLILEENGVLRFDTAVDSSRGDIAQPDFEVSRSVVHDALEKMASVRLSNAVDDPLLGHNPSVVSLELRSILCTPFRISENLRGAIYLDHRLRTAAFGDRSQRLCELLADQAALAILQVRRVEEIRQLNERLELRVVQQESDLAQARSALERAGGSVERSKLVGSSAVMEGVRQLLGRAAQADLPALITGASGTGKEIAARTLHERSRRSDGPFVSENCAALPESLIESELFGYRRGAFTGAEEDRQGLFERAHGGTLFLDEIGEMPAALQAKLLRVLETGEVRRLGDSESRPVDFRLVAATNRDLERESAEGSFRQDLFYRLDGLRVEMPSLAERPEDIPELVEHFLVQDGTPGSPRRATRSVLAALARRSWPGNVRELRNELARLSVLCEGDLDDPELVRRPTAQAPASEESGPRTLAEVERAAILEALSFTGDDKRRAAELLGISRAKIYQRLKDWGIKESS